MSLPLRILFFLLLLAVVSPSCKKAEDDPWLSLRSRTARLTGEWVVKRYHEDVTMGTPDGPEHVIIDADEYSYSHWSDVASNNFSNGIGTHKYTFTKDGGITTVLSLTFTLPDSTQTVDERTFKGKWEFLDGSGSYENKERIVVFWEETTLKSSHEKDGYEYSATYSSKEFPELSEMQVMELDELRNKKLRMSWDILNQLSFSENLLGQLAPSFVKNGFANIEMEQ